MNQEKIGKFIAENRKKKKLKQSELAEILGVTDRSVSNWENGKCMPDLSLFKPLCQELEITINELMSGEKVSKEEYQNKLEENIIELTINNKKKISKKIKILISTIVLLITILLLSTIIYNTIEIDVSYDKNLMKCHIENNTLTYEVIGNSLLNTKYIEKEIDDRKIYIFHSTINIYNKRHSNYEYGKSLSKIVEGKEIPFGSYWEINLNEQMEVYYSDKPLSKIKKLNDKELKKEIKNLHPMCNTKQE